MIAEEFFMLAVVALFCLVATTRLLRTPSEPEYRVVRRRRRSTSRSDRVHA